MTMSGENRAAGPHLFVIIGASGDLAQRKLFPVLFDLLSGRDPGARAQILGAGSRDIGDAGLREKTRQSLVAAGKDPKAAAAWCKDLIQYHCLGPSPGDFDTLSPPIAEHGTAHE